MDPNLLAWAPYLIGATVLLSFKQGRWVLRGIFTVALVICFLMWISEPDLRD